MKVQSFIIPGESKYLTENMDEFLTYLDKNKQIIGIIKKIPEQPINDLDLLLSYNICCFGHFAEVNLNDN